MRGESTKSDLIYSWDRVTCELSSGEKIELKLSSSWKKEKVKSEIDMFCDRIFNDVRAQLDLDPFWTALTPDEQEEKWRPGIYRDVKGKIWWEKEFLVHKMSQDFLQTVKQMTTRQQQEVLDFLGYYLKGKISAIECKEEKLCGFFFVDKDTGNRYLTNGAGWKNAPTILLRPDGTIEHETLMIPSKSIRLEEIHQYIVIGESVGVKIEFVPASRPPFRLDVCIFPGLNTLNRDGEKLYPFYLETKLSAEMSKTSSEVEGCPQGWIVEGFSIKVSGGSSMSPEEASCLFRGQLIAAAIINDFKTFIESPRFWLNARSFQANILP